MWGRPPVYRDDEDDDDDDYDMHYDDDDHDGDRMRPPSSCGVARPSLPCGNYPPQHHQHQHHHGSSPYQSIANDTPPPDYGSMPLHDDRPDPPERAPSGRKKGQGKKGKKGKGQQKPPCPPQFQRGGSSSSCSSGMPEEQYCAPPPGGGFGGSQGGADAAEEGEDDLDAEIMAVMARVPSPDLTRQAGRVRSATSLRLSRCSGSADPLQSRASMCSRGGGSSSSKAKSKRGSNHSTSSDCLQRQGGGGGGGGGGGAYPEGEVPLRVFVSRWGVSKVLYVTPGCSKAELLGRLGERFPRLQVGGVCFHLDGGVVQATDETLPLFAQLACAPRVVVQ